MKKVKLRNSFHSVKKSISKTFNKLSKVPTAAAESLNEAEVEGEKVMEKEEDGENMKEEAQVMDVKLKKLVEVAKNECVAMEEETKEDEELLTREVMEAIDGKSINDGTVESEIVEEVLKQLDKGVIGAGNSMELDNNDSNDTAMAAAHVEADESDEDIEDRLLNTKSPITPDSNAAADSEAPLDTTAAVQIGDITKEKMDDMEEVEEPSDAGRMGY